MNPFDRYWLRCAAVVYGLMAVPMGFGVFDDWPWWLWWPFLIAVAFLASELGDWLRERAEARTPTDRETPP